MQWLVWSGWCGVIVEKRLVCNGWQGAVSVER